MIFSIDQTTCILTDSFYKYGNQSKDKDILKSVLTEELLEFDAASLQHLADRAFSTMFLYFLFFIVFRECLKDEHSCWSNLS